MIDGISLNVVGSETYRNIVTNGSLKFQQLRGKRQAKYKGLIFNVIDESRRCFIKGSLHKYKNGGLHNFDDYGRSDFQNSLEDLYNELGIDPRELLLCGLELGVNMQLNETPSSIIQSVINIDKRQPQIERKRGRIIGMRCRFCEYELKFYSKSELANTKEYILRYEIKFLKSRKLRSELGYIRTLDELDASDVWDNMRSCLVRNFDKIHIIDVECVDVECMSSKEKTFFLYWINPMAFERETSRVKRYRALNNLDRLSAQYSSRDIKKDLYHLLESKMSQLMM